MDIQKEREAYKAALKNLENEFFFATPFDIWLAAKREAQAVPEKDAVIKKLSDQLYAQEMKASAARVLCETACELLDDYAHQDAMVILNDLEQAMKEST